SDSKCHQAVLSKSMSSCLVDVICSHLSSKRTVSEFEGQVVRSQPTDLQKASQLLQMVLRKGSEVCQQFYQALERFDPRLFEKVTGSPAVVPLSKVLILNYSSRIIKVYKWVNNCKLLITVFLSCFGEKRQINLM
uniref:CARD domain-containing protein n=1 Tax=Scleropages formosus TaxID=113540 RepID=A0A8C9RGY4_SCLFO